MRWRWGQRAAGEGHRAGRAEAGAAPRASAVLAATAVCEPAWGHTWAAQGGFEARLITFQIEPPGYSTLPPWPVPHETDARYKLRRN